MVCKINFDYEIPLSDDNDSIASSIFSNDEREFSRKFVLGDNIRTVNPVEVFSVRQINDYMATDSDDSNYGAVQNIPMKHDLYYDESISAFDEESVTESEYDLYSDLVNLPDKRLHYNSQPLNYQLPTVDRFQLVPVVEPLRNIDAVGQYCLNEKQRRLQADVAKTSDSHEKPSINGKKCHIDCDNPIPSNQKVTKVPQNKLNDSSIPPEVLSKLPIDLLAAFIDGEKSLHEILHHNKSNRLIADKKKRKSKRQKANKKSSKKVEPLAYPLDSSMNNRSQFNDKLKTSDLIQQPEDSSNKIDHSITISSTTPDDGNESVAIENVMPELSTYLDKQEQFVENNICEVTMDGDKFKSHKEDQTFTLVMDDIDCTVIDIEDKNDHGNHLNNNIDGSSDKRTSSTDSGFHEIDSSDSNDEVTCLKPQEESHCIKPSQPRSVDEFINLSSFKYRFINNSDITISLVTDEITTPNDVLLPSPSMIGIVTNPNPLAETINESNLHRTQHPHPLIHCDPFKTNYYSPESAIDSHQEISQFLNYQWLKFCEKYTLYNHQSMML